jgi:hypothetical protein
VQAVVLHAEDPVVCRGREAKWESEVLVERAGHAFDVDRAQILQNVQQEASRGEALFEVFERAGVEFSVPGLVKLVREVFWAERGCFLFPSWWGGGQSVLKLFP